jgi:hypothetical protein
MFANKQQWIGIVANRTDRSKSPRRTRRRAARPSGPAAPAPKQPRFARFASAMAAARAANAPQLALYRDAPADDLGVPRHPVVRWLGIGSCVVLFGLLLSTMLT